MAERAQPPSGCMPTYRNNNRRDPLHLPDHRVVEPLGIFEAPPGLIPDAWVDLDEGVPVLPVPDPARNGVWPLVTVISA